MSIGPPQPRPVPPNTHGLSPIGAFELAGAGEVAKVPAGGDKTGSISWYKFLREELPHIIEELSPRYESDFKEFLREHMVALIKAGVSLNDENLRREFMKARVLFDLLKSGGVWGFAFGFPVVQQVHRPPSTLKRLATAAGQKDGATKKTLFCDDCDNIAFLYSETAAHLGLKSEVRLIVDNHVNVFVKVGKTELRMDPTGLCNFEGIPWMLPWNDYVPEKLYKTGRSDPVFMSALGYLLHVSEVHPHWIPY